MDKILRRIDADQNEPVELFLRLAIKGIENMPADIRTTQAILLVHSARNLVADIIDENIKAKKPKK